MIFKQSKMLFKFIASYFLPDYSYDYWHCPHKRSAYIDQGDYFIDFTPKTVYPGPFDDQGIPLLDLSSQHWSRHRKTVYAPIVISQYGLGWYSSFLRTRNPSALETFIHTAKWLCNYAVCEHNGERSLAILYADYGDGPTRSGMAQGLAISVWCRAFRETGNTDYLNAARRAFAAFGVDIAAGGVIDDAGFPVIQEWVDDRIHILNGHLFGFAAVADLMRTETDPEQMAKVRACYETFLDSSLQLIHRCDMGFWTRYSLRDTLIPNTASYFYHGLHIEMLHGLYLLTGAPDFDRWAERWEKQRKRYSGRGLAMILKLADRAYSEWIKRQS